MFKKTDIRNLSIKQNKIIEEKLSNSFAITCGF